MRLNDKVAIVTGSAQGIGRAMALAFAREGARLVIADINQVGAEETALQIRSLGGQALALRVDVADPVQVERMVSRTMEQYGQIDILINDAAVVRYAPFLEMRLEDWQSVTKTTLEGYFLCGQAVAREMVKRRTGKIVNLSSVAAERGDPGGAAYAAAKNGVIALTRVMAVELAEYGITVNAIAPSAVETEMVARLLTPEAKEARMKAVPLGRFAQPEEIAAAALYLVSTDADYITGEVLHIDGGRLCVGVAVKTAGAGG